MELEKNILNLPSLAWENILKYLSPDDLLHCSMVSKRFQELIQNNGKKKKIDLSETCNVNVKYLLNEVLSKQCTSINLNHCYWIEPNIILQILSKTRLKELHVVECQINKRVINAIFHLNLTSLSLSFDADWLRQLSRKKDRSAHFFAAIKNLKVFCPVTNSFSLFECLWNLCEKLLPLCGILEHFTIYTDPHQAVSPSSDIYKLRLFDKFKNLCTAESQTPVPYLKSLVVDLADCCNLHIVAFLKVLFHKKTVPLEYVYFGKHSNGIIMQPIFSQILPLIKVSSTFCLSSSYQSMALNVLANQSKWEGVHDVKSLLKERNYKRYVMENLVFDNLLPVAADICDNSAETVEEINFHGSIINSDFIFSLQAITLRCQRLTVLKLSIQNWTEDNESVFKLLSKLSNLQVLHLPSAALGIWEDLNSNLGNTNTPVEEKIPIFSFKKVTINCKRLKEIRVVHVGRVLRPFGVIHEDTLSHIKHCENLKELHLAHFFTFGLNPALPKIAKQCTRLKALYVTDVINLDKNNHRTSYLTRSLKHAKSIKYLSLKLPCKINLSFVEAFRSCENLEKVYMDSLFLEPSACHSFENYLPKMKKLCMFYLHNCRYRNTGYDGALNKTLKKIKVAKPAFFFKLESSEENIFNEIPITHLHMLQHVPKTMSIM